MGLKSCSPHTGPCRATVVTFTVRKVVGDTWENMRIWGQGLETHNKLKSCKG